MKKIGKFLETHPSFPDYHFQSFRDQRTRAKKCKREFSQYLMKSHEKKGKFNFIKASTPLAKGQAIRAKGAGSKDKMFFYAKTVLQPRYRCYVVPSCPNNFGIKIPLILPSLGLKKKCNWLHQNAQKKEGFFLSIWSGLGDLKIEIQGRQCQPPPHIVDYHVIWLGSAVSYLMGLKSL